MSDLTNSMKASTMSVSSKKQQAKHNDTSATENSPDKLGLSNPALWYSGGFIALFVAIALYDGELLSTLVNTGFAWSVKVFGRTGRYCFFSLFLLVLAWRQGEQAR